MHTIYIKAKTIHNYELCYMLRRYIAVLRETIQSNIKSRPAIQIYNTKDKMLKANNGSRKHKTVGTLDKEMLSYS
jgi:hypothetical protein